MRHDGYIMRVSPNHPFTPCRSPIWHRLPASHFSPVSCPRGCRPRTRWTGCWPRPRRRSCRGRFSRSSSSASQLTKTGRSASPPSLSSPAARRVSSLSFLRQANPPQRVNAMWVNGPPKSREPPRWHWPTRLGRGCCSKQRPRFRQTRNPAILPKKPPQNRPLRIPPLPPRRKPPRSARRH